MKRTGRKLAVILMLGAAMVSGCKKAEKIETAGQPEVQITGEATEAPEATEQGADSPVETAEAEQGAEGLAEPNAVSQPEEQIADGTEAVPEVQVTAFSFADVENLYFYFSSGAGGWYTVLYIHGDGSFDGHFQDSDMGDTADEYPNGTLYYSDFSGRFTEPEQVDDLTYRFRIASMDFPYGFGEEIKDGIRYCYSSAYGLDEAEDLYLYLPGSKVKDLPEEFRTWVGYYDPDAVAEEELPFYGLYNENAENGFSSYETVTESAADEAEDTDGQAADAQTENAASRVDEILAGAEKQAAAVEARLQQARSQGDMNMISGELYQVWDDALNGVWKILKETLDEESMKALTQEERAWIAEKERAVKEAGAEFEGGTMAPLVMNQTAADMTRDRVYELAKKAK